MTKCRTSINRLRRRTQRAALVGGLLAMMTATAVPASAAVVHTHPFVGSFDGTGSTSSSGPTGPFSSVGSLAVDHQTQSVYVGDSGNIDKFDPAGVPQAFSGLGPGITALSTGSSGSFGTGLYLAVDNSGAAAQSRLYAITSNEQLHAFNVDGSEVGGAFPIPGLETTCGLATDGSGNPWVVGFHLGVRGFDSAGSPLGLDFSPGFSCPIAIDPNPGTTAPGGYFYIGGEGDGGTGVHVYDASRNFVTTLESDATYPSDGYAHDLAVDPTTQHVYVLYGDHVTEFDHTGTTLGTFGRKATGDSFGGLCPTADGIAVNNVTHQIYVGNCNRVAIFGLPADRIFPNAVTDPPTTDSTSAILRGHVDPDGGGETVECYFEWDIDTTYATKVPCDQGPISNVDGNTAVSAEIDHLVEGTSYHFRLVASNANGPGISADRTFRAQNVPTISALRARDVKSDGVELIGTLNPQGGKTTYHFEVGVDTSYGTNLPIPDEEFRHETKSEEVATFVTNLTPDTTYHYRFVAENEAGKLVSDDNTFTTFDTPDETIDPCTNAHARRQTNSSRLLDCRAYELASAANAGGYDVKSDLVPGQEPPLAYPDASGHLLYSLHYGKIPGITGDPTNFGGDPYVATRGTNGWGTEYVGIPANFAPASETYGSPLLAADAALKTFAFGGPSICAPCFADGKTGIPVRLPTGQIVQGMTGAIDPGAGVTQTGYVGRRLSSDGSHLLFGSISPLEPDGNGNGDVSIYIRDLGSGQTRVVSKTPGGATMTGSGIGALDISSDGSRVLFGRALSSDAAGNSLWKLFMNIAGSNQTVELAPTMTTGGLFAGMTTDGSKVFFTTSDQLVASDTDSSRDLYQASIDSGGVVTLARISTGTLGTGNTNTCTPDANAEGPRWNDPAGSANCGVATFSGGAGVSSVDGTIYFLSPEKLDGDGSLGAPNLFVVEPGDAPAFVATLDPNDALVVHAVYDADLVTRGDIQVTPNGDVAVFDTRQSLTGYPNLGFEEIFRHDSGSGVVCVSCAPTNAAPTGDATLSETGLNLTDDGRVFFTTPDQLVLRDTGRKRDAYEWRQGVLELISTGTSISHSGLLSVSRDGSDAFFYTRDVLVPEDENGSALKVYDARAGGGYPVDAPQVPCQASDECHGAGTVAPPPPPIGTYRGTGGNVTAPKAHKKHPKKKRGRKDKKPGKKGHKQSRNGRRHG